LFADRVKEKMRRLSLLKRTLTARVTMRIEHPRSRSTERFAGTTNPKTAGKEKEEKEAREKAQESRVKPQSWPPRQQRRKPSVGGLDRGLGFLLIVERRTQMATNGGAGTHRQSGRSWCVRCWRRSYSGCPKATGRRSRRWSSRGRRCVRSWFLGSDFSGRRLGRWLGDCGEPVRAACAGTWD